MLTISFRRQINDLLFTVIAMLVEDKHDIALASGDGALTDAARAEHLKTIGEDIAILAQAAAIIARRSAPGRGA